MDDNIAVLVITPALVYDMEGEVYVLLADIVQGGDDLRLPDGYGRGFRQAVVYVLVRSLHRPVR